MTAGQLRAARALLRWTADQLAQASGVSVVTIRRSEPNEGPVRMIPANADALRRTLEAAGIDAPDARRCAADVLAEDGKPRFVWADVAAHEDAYDYAVVIASAVAQAKRWREQYQHAKTVAEQRGSPPDQPVDGRSATATGEAA